MIGLPDAWLFTERSVVQVEKAEFGSYSGTPEGREPLWRGSGWSVPDQPRLRSRAVGQGLCVANETCARWS